MIGKIIGVGNFIPSELINIAFFDRNVFLNVHGETLVDSNAVAAEKLTEITGIQERRYAQEDQVASDLGYLAAKAAMDDAGIDPESLDYVIFAHNFGDVPA